MPQVIVAVSLTHKKYFFLLFIVKHHLIKAPFYVNTVTASLEHLVLVCSKMTVIYWAVLSVTTYCI